MMKRLAVFSLASMVGSALAGIPDAMNPDYELKEVPLAEKYLTMGMGFLSDGRLAIVTTDSVLGGQIPKAKGKTHRVLVISNPDGAAPSVKEIANTWWMPVGLTIVNDKIYISDRDGFYEIQSLNPNASELDANRKKIASWPGMPGSAEAATWNFGDSWHQFVFDPVYWQGNFYAPYSGSIRPGGWSDVNPTSQFSGAFLKWDLTGKLNKVAGGLRSPNGVGMNPTGDMFVCDNQGSWLPSSTFMHMKQGKFYGHRQSPSRNSDGSIKENHTANWAESLPYERPTAWLDHGNVRSSPTQPLFLDKGRYAGDWIFGDENNYGLVRVALDKVDDIENGAVFWFGKGMKSVAINRLVSAKDGSIYLGTIKTIGNWPPPDSKPQAIYRLVPKANDTLFDMKAIRSLNDGVEIEFTDAVNPSTVTAGNFPVTQWNYTRKEEYGQGKGGNEPRTVSATEISADGKRVHLKVAGLKDDYVTYFKLGAVKSMRGTGLWNNEAWFTLNKISTRAWDATTAIAKAPKAGSSLDALVRTHISKAGVLLTLDMPGRVNVTLRALSGAALRAANGSGTLLVPTQGLSKGVYLLEVRQGSETLVRPVSLSF